MRPESILVIETVYLRPLALADHYRHRKDPSAFAVLNSGSLILGRGDQPATKEAGEHDGLVVYRTHVIQTPPANIQRTAGTNTCQPGSGIASRDAT